MHGAESIEAEIPTSWVTADVTTAVDRVYREHGASVFRVALRLGRGNRAWAEDVTQEVFLDLMGALDRIEDPARIAGWLYRATVHRCLGRLRRERFFARPMVRWFLTEQGQSAPDPERIHLGRADLDALFERVAALPDKERVVFCMRHLDGTPQREIAEIIGHSEGYVSKLLKRAEQRIGPREAVNTGRTS